MAEAGVALAEILANLSSRCRPGVSTDQLDSMASEMIALAGAQPAFLDYNGYPSSLCVSINDEVIHGLPGNRKLRSGDLVSLDLGITKGGFAVDAGVTVGVGKISPEAKRILEVTKTALSMGISQARVGNHIGDIGHAIESYVSANGYFVIKEFSGHGIGRAMHEEPSVPNFGEPGQGMLIKAGLVLAIEPMVTANSSEVTVSSDGWTVKTLDGSLACYFEHTVAVTEFGGRILTELKS